ncbi:DUF2184 domain-containing protein [Desulfovibrio desulfuricans]|uniref:DUF2184 domain-containing protein n=1 Tax=Desulfovibrio desulfuricans TaxID=876 RepID=UPI00210CB0D2|nr:DUF2184 domain-containing protein [Desulfovibrio desulfuricans]MCQ4861156.1 DUF2184 domain-containing protein [Desulfovibrio desulfuricans]
MFTFDKKTIRDAGAFFIGELERLDPELHAPLASVTWGRDIDLREDVVLGDELSSFTNSSFAAAGGIYANGINWVGKDSTAIAGMAVSIDKTSKPLRLWGQEIGFSVQELAAAQRVGRPIDLQKFDGLKLKHQMDIDQMVYLGDEVVGATGLCNNASITPMDETKTWEASTPLEILKSINRVLEAAWEQTGFAVLPDRLLVPPMAMSKLTQPITDAGSKSVLQYVREQCLCNTVNGRLLDIAPVKHLSGAGQGQKDRMVAYTKNRQYVRYPLVPLQHTPVEYRGLYQVTTYYAALGELEFVYPETVAYADGI